MSSGRLMGTPSAFPTPRAERDELVVRLRELERAARPLDPGAGRRKRLRSAVVASTERFLRRIDAPQGIRGHGGERRAACSTRRSPRTGSRSRPRIALLEREVVGPGANPATPGHLAYIPGGGLYHAALGDFLAAVTNKYAGVFFGGPGAVRMENMLVRWVADLVGYPASAAGGTSPPAAASRRWRPSSRRGRPTRVAGAEVSRAVVYLTSQAHHCIEKALRIAGSGRPSIGRSRWTIAIRLRPDALAQAIEADRARGLRPWLVVASAGTTDTGAIDPLEEVATIAGREGCWFHVDAAYGGFFLLTAHGRRAAPRHRALGLGGARSAQGPVSALRLRDRGRARREPPSWPPTATPAHYMQDALREPGRDLAGRRLARALQALPRPPDVAAAHPARHPAVPGRAGGEAPSRAVLPSRGRSRWASRSGPSPELSIVTFRWAPPACGPGARPTRSTSAIVDGVRRDGRVFLSSTMLDGRFTLRLVGAGIPDAPADDRSGAPGAAGAAGGRGLADRRSGAGLAVCYH